MLKAIVKFAGYVWETGKHLMDAEVTLGSADKSSSCKVTLADPEHKIAAAVLQHTQETGGIQALPDAAKTTESQVIPGIKAGGSAVVGGGGASTSTGDGFTPEVRAFADAVAMRETQIAKALSEGQSVSDPGKMYYSNNTIAKGYFTEADILAGGGFPKSAGTSQNVGKYQVNRGDWADAKKANPAIKGFSPADQDLVYLYKIDKINRGGKELRAGDVKAAFRKAANEWVSIPGGPQYQPQGEDKALGQAAVLEKYYTYYQKRLAFYKGQTGQTAQPPAKPVTPAKPEVKVAGEPQ